ncbi:MAG: sensor histidine kinase [Planctomycetia bacterium]
MIRSEGVVDDPAPASSIAEEAAPRVYARDEVQRLLAEQASEIASLAGGLVHEIKNPLSTLHLNLQLLGEDFHDPQSVVERRAKTKIDMLQRECRRLEDLLNDFLRFVRVRDLNPAPVDLNSIVRDLIDFHSPQAETRGIVTRENLRADLPLVRVDVDQFKQALLNLLLNAQTAMPNGGELILQTRAADGVVCLDVIDTGVGVAPESLEKIFKPFYSTRSDGSGLGLPTTKRIVEAHDGRLKVESEPGKGTAFTIELPAARDG